MMLLSNKLVANKYFQALHKKKRDKCVSFDFWAGFFFMFLTFFAGFLDFFFALAALRCARAPTCFVTKLLQKKKNESIFALMKNIE